VVLALTAVGCAEQDPALSQRVDAVRARRAAERRLDETDYKGARLELAVSDGGANWCPSAPMPAQLRAILHAGEATLRTPIHKPEAASNAGFLPQSSVVAVATGVTLGPDWVLVGPNKPSALLALMNKPAAVTAHLARQPAVTASLTLKTSFDCDQAVEFPGRTGRAGGKGGAHGEDGEAGLNVVVAVSYLHPPGGPKLVLVKAVPSQGIPQNFVLTPGRRLGINVRGGDGGQGGEGRVAGVEFTGGLGGDGGNGGEVEVRYDERSPELRDVVTVVNPGGKGGAPGAGASASAAGRAGRPGPPAHYRKAEVEKVFADEIEDGLPVLRSGQAKDQI
jgi:hypothetical protein